MKLAILAITLAAATTVSSAAPSHDFAARSPEPSWLGSRGCKSWWQVCGVKAKRDASNLISVTQESVADQYSQVIKSLSHAKELANSGSEPTAMDSTGYTHEAFLYDFYGGGKAPATAKNNATSTPGCVHLGLCNI
jgi:hypothetical protein